MRVDEAFKQRVYELCKLNKISFSTLCKNCKVNRNRVFEQGKGLNIKILKPFCQELNISIKLFFKSDVFNNLEF